MIIEFIDSLLTDTCRNQKWLFVPKNNQITTTGLLICNNPIEAFAPSEGIVWSSISPLLFSSFTMRNVSLYFDKTSVCICHINTLCCTCVVSKEIIRDFYPRYIEIKICYFFSLCKVIVYLFCKWFLENFVSIWISRCGKNQSVRR